MRHESSEPLEQPGHNLTPCHFYSYCPAGRRGARPDQLISGGPQKPDAGRDCLRTCGHIVETRVSVTCALRVELVLEGLPTTLLSAAFHYSITDPFGVRLLIAPRETAVEWTFARDLLQAGLQQPSGTGHVQIWPMRFPTEKTDPTDLICISLKSPDEDNLLRVSRVKACMFLERTYSMVAAGAEKSDVDSLCLILGDSLS